jgi:hypothetical protein
MTESEATKRRKVDHVAAVNIYDFTFFGMPDEDFPTHEEFIRRIQPIFKKWVFQKEACPTSGKYHYQGRGSLIKKKRHPELCGMLNSTDLRGMYVSESSNNSKTLEIFYALKLDTRIEGPWEDRTWLTPAFIPRQSRGLIDRLHPWQTVVLESRNEFNDRVINFVYDKEGNNGKSTCAALGELNYGAIYLPPVDDHKELTQVACDILMNKQCRTPGLVFVDLPRGLTSDPKKFGAFTIGIEQIKKGHVCDVRHHYKDWWFDSPSVWTFANHVPDTGLMSSDRWRFWYIDQLKNLQPLTRSEVLDLYQGQM